MSSTAHSRARDPSRCFNHRARKPTFIVGAAAAALLVSAHSFARAAKSSSRMAQEHHACAVVLGLDPSGDRYETCVRSLERSLSEWDQERMVESQRSACDAKGLEPGTPAFAVCVVNAGQSP
jgi:hypothetical protein